MHEDLEVTHNEARQRYEAEVEGQLAVLDYRLRGTSLTLTYTGVPKPLEGRGIGSALVKVALDDARENGFSVIPECPFVGTFVRRHQEYLPIIDEGSREALRRK